MLFNSYIFILCFLPLTLIVYYLLNGRKRYSAAKVWLLAMSLWFYGYFHVSYLLILCTSILLNYMCMHFFMKTEKPVGRKLLLLAGLAYNIGILFYFKYYDFFIENINGVFGTDFTLHHVILPLGISFFTFQQLSFVIDSYQRKVPDYTLLDYAVFVTFFPQLIAGPIVLHSELIPQLCDETKKAVNYDNIAKGIYGFALGLAKKVLIADTFSKIVTAGYADIPSLGTAGTLIIMLAYTFQVYFDFSGYCDMALGIGCLFNIDIPVNFNSPYKAKSIAEFWDRWHMTLTRFFTQYVYIPLGGSRKGTLRTYVNTLLVFFISGLWHGANWTFVLWGCMHGIMLVLYKMFQTIFDKIPGWIRWCVTFAAVNITWVYFRADSIAQANSLIRRLFAGNIIPLNDEVNQSFLDLIEIKALYRFGFGDFLRSYPTVPLLVFLAVILAAVILMKNTQEKMREFKPTAKKMAVSCILVVWCVLSMADVSEFLYFNF